MRQLRPWLDWYDGKRLRTALLVVVALLFQGYVSQAHFHNLAAFDASRATISDGLTSGVADDPANLPANLPDGHNADCAICHWSGLAGTSVLPASIALLQPADSSPVFASGDPAPTTTALAWTHAPRGPPIFFVHS